MNIFCVFTIKVNISEATMKEFLKRKFSTVAVAFGAFVGVATMPSCGDKDTEEEKSITNMSDLSFNEHLHIIENFMIDSIFEKKLKETNCKEPTLDTNAFMALGYLVNGQKTTGDYRFMNGNIGKSTVYDRWCLTGPIVDSVPVPKIYNGRKYSWPKYRWRIHTAKPDKKGKTHWTYVYSNNEIDPFYDENHEPHQGWQTHWEAGYIIDKKEYIGVKIPHALTIQDSLQSVLDKYHRDLRDFYDIRDSIHSEIWYNFVAPESRRLDDEFRQTKTRAKTIEYVKQRVNVIRSKKR